VVLVLLKVSKSLVLLLFWSFVKVHGPNLRFVECLMKACGDLDWSSVNEVMNSTKCKVKDKNLMDHMWHIFVQLSGSSYIFYMFVVLAPEPTIMKKIKSHCSSDMSYSCRSINKKKFNIITQQFGSIKEVALVVTTTCAVEQ
jgi:hypothetical protein